VDNIREYGLRHFKIKLSANDGDVERLSRCLSVVNENAGREWAFSLDGNESYTSGEQLQAFWEQTAKHPSIAPHLPRLLFLEQPFYRDFALSPEVAQVFASWQNRPPVVIDESDAGTESLPLALSLGYAGTSHKNCKGVFKGVVSAARIAHANTTRPASTPPLLLTGEDLSNIGPFALHQDLAVQAALGVQSVERNGHHYFRGLAPFGPEVAQATMSGSNLYATVNGVPCLHFTDGMLNLSDINAHGFGAGNLVSPDIWAERVSE
jgi:hypothetical protein